MPNLLNLLIQDKHHNFTHIIEGYNEYVEYDGLRKPLKAVKYLTGGRLIARVKADAFAWLKENKKPLEKYNIEDLELDYFKKTIAHNRKLITNNIEEYGFAVDMDYCYWQTAFNLGIITKATFKMGISKKIDKKLRLIAIGSLAKNTLRLNYLDGKVSSKTLTKPPTVVAHTLIVTTVNKLLVELNKKYKNSIYFFLTDCFYIKKEYINDFKKELFDRGYKYKIFPFQLSDIRTNEFKSDVLWREDKESTGEYSQRALGFGIRKEIK